MTSQETNTTPVIDLSISRARIDEIDAQIIELFERRMHIAADVAAYKRATGKPVLDKAREAAKIDKATELASDEFKKFIPPLFSMMMEMSRAYQHSLLDEVSEGVVPAAIDEVAELPAAAHVAVQGVEGAYQHIACRELFDDPDIVFVPTFDAVADAVEDGRVEYGILPLENSTAGTVDRVYDLLYKRGLYIARAITLRINHDLLAKPGVEASDIVEVFSHEQALRQCTEFIAQMPNEVTSTACRNTAMAASSVANSERRDVAAISSTACAELYGLNVLQHGGDHGIRQEGIGQQRARQDGIIRRHGCVAQAGGNGQMQGQIAIGALATLERAVRSRAEHMGPLQVSAQHRQRQRHYQQQPQQLPFPVI